MGFYSVSRVFQVRFTGPLKRVTSLASEGKCPANRNVFAADGFRYLPDVFFVVDVTREVEA